MLDCSEIRSLLRCVIPSNLIYEIDYKNSSDGNLVKNLVKEDLEVLVKNCGFGDCPIIDNIAHYIIILINKIPNRLEYFFSKRIIDSSTRKYPSYEVSIKFNIVTYVNELSFIPSATKKSTPPRLFNPNNRVPKHIIESESESESESERKCDSDCESCYDRACESDCDCYLLEEK